MRKLEFIVSGQELKRNPKCNFTNIIAGTSEYLAIKMVFDECWNKCKRAISFFKEDGEETAVLLDENDTCVVPPAFANETKFYISATGCNGSYIITTNRSAIRQEV